ncbi:hypothetical protein [Peribacillus frigoritolerans]|uniref:hypothetical protein n=1 Tax=Peribacillus frigoritolerans TaxID=450367 RepID=UPI002040B213|nr:hypothetical protein [Peribacillus frigoritolerans]MCM3169473.1 hypothetical protein [Peribacillus frigoritolerans]
MNYQMAIVKEVGEKDVLLVVGNKEYIVPLSSEEANGLHHVLMNHENVLIPFNEFDKKIALDKVEPWHELELEELQGNDEYEMDEEGRVL